MIAFPLIQELRVERYPLFPGENKDHVLDLALGNGPWVILGVNGLGKSTILLLMRYLLAGPIRLRDAGFAGDRQDVMAGNARLFAMRVAGGAKDSLATLKVQFGDLTVEVTRRLDNLSIHRAEITKSGQATEISSETDYQLQILKAMNLGRFDDAVRVFDFVTFFLEARRPLIWDLSAQFELFRATLTPDLSAQLRELEGQIVSSDSLARGLNANVFSIQKRRNAEARKAQKQDTTQAELSTERAAYEEAEASAKKSEALAEEIEQEVDDAFLLVKRAEKDVDDLSREYELLKYESLKAVFEKCSVSEQYVFLRLLSDEICLVCGASAPEAADELRGRLGKGLCPICGNKHLATSEGDDANHGNKITAIAQNADKAYALLSDARADLEEKRRAWEDRRAAFSNERQKVTAFSEEAAIKARKIRLLEKRLPIEDRSRLEKEAERLSSLREQVEISRQERADAEKEISGLLAELKSKTEQIRDALEKRFNALAQPFFAERVRLVYAPRSTRIGQQGTRFDFPAFEVELTSGATHGDFVRRTSEQVSLSQRDYLDLIFRMALIDVLGDETGTLVVDGPEGSVDAVFAERAGDLFAKFSKDTRKSTVLACNIVEGGFIPHTLSFFAEKPQERVIDLLDLTVPTAALSDLRPEYEEKVQEIYGRTRQFV